MVYCGPTDGPDRQTWCGEDGFPQRWGWTNRVGTNLNCIIGAAKGNCVESNGFDAGFITIDQATKSFTVFLDTGVTMTEYHVSKM
jgi:hypothetical protein